MDPNAPVPPPAPVDPNAPAPAPAPANPNAPPPPAPEEPGRVDNAAGNFSFVVPQGWVVGDASKLNYGQVLLSKETGPAGQRATGSGRQRHQRAARQAGPETVRRRGGRTTGKAAVRLASDMGEGFMPYPHTGINPQTFPLDANGMTGSASSYEVKFTDTTKPNGQIWAGVVGNANVNAPRGQRNERWFVVWLGTAKNPMEHQRRCRAGQFDPAVEPAAAATGTRARSERTGRTTCGEAKVRGCEVGPPTPPSRVLPKLRTTSASCTLLVKTCRRMSVD